MRAPESLGDDPERLAPHQPTGQFVPFGRRQLSGRPTQRCRPDATGLPQVTPDVVRRQQQPLGDAFDRFTGVKSQPNRVLLVLGHPIGTHFCLHPKIISWWCVDPWRPPWVALLVRIDVKQLVYVWNRRLLYKVTRTRLT